MRAIPHGWQAATNESRRKLTRPAPVRPSGRAAAAKRDVGCSSRRTPQASPLSARPTSLAERPGRGGVPALHPPGRGRALPGCGRGADGVPFGRTRLERGTQWARLPPQPARSSMPARPVLGLAPRRCWRSTSHPTGGTRKAGRACCAGRARPGSPTPTRTPGRYPTGSPPTTRTTRSPARPHDQRPGPPARPRRGACTSQGLAVGPGGAVACGVAPHAGDLALVRQPPACRARPAARPGRARHGRR
jgi:hypothetical protein